MGKLFDSVKVSAPKLNKFDLSHEKKLSFNMGDMIPVAVQEVLPGDRFRWNTEVLLRLAPMLAPVMHRVWCKMEFFFVPNRLMYEDWEDFITGGRLGVTEPVWPYMGMNNATKSYTAGRGLLDYLGFPDLTAQAFSEPPGAMEISVLPMRAYQMIYNEYYRDQNLTAPIDFSLAGGDMAFIAGELDRLCTIRKCCWEKDYFTSALPWSQRGAAVAVPVGGEATPIYKEVSEFIDSVGDGPDEAPDGVQINAGEMISTPPGGDGEPLRVENIESITLDEASVLIMDLRRSARLQEWLEKNALGGARYTESNLVHFGVKSSDARLQRPEFLGGGRQPIVMSEVLSTVQMDGSAPQGNMAGHGISVGGRNGFDRRFEEHGIIIGILRVLPRTAYQQGISRLWIRSNKFEYPWPEFAHLGEQEIKGYEVVADTDDVENLETWGYQSRYAEWKYGCSTTHGDFKTTLNFWTMTRIFADTPGPLLPPLNQSFVEADPTTRIFNVESPGVDKLYCQLFHKVDVLRALPYFATPRL